MRQQYRALCLLAIFLLAACSSQAAPPSFNVLSAQRVIDALNAAGATVQNPVSDTVVGRDAPATFSERVVFEVARIAPNGGQILIFQTAQDLQAWTEYIARLQADPDQRRSVIYIYTNANAMLQLNADLTNQEAALYRDAFLALTASP
jgi:hypothetical protein